VKALLFLLSSIYLTFPVSCRPVENRNADKSGLEETKTMNTASFIEQNRVQIKELVRFSWNKPEGLLMIKTGEPLTSLLYSEQQAPEAVIAAYRFRISESGNKIVVLSNDPLYTSDYSSSLDFLAYDIANKMARKTSVPMSDSRVEKSEIVDFLLGNNNNLYLLERLLTKERTTINRLRHIEAGGKIIWEIEAKVGTENPGQNGLLFGKCRALLKEMKDTVFLQTETSAKTFVLKIDSNTGKTEEWLSVDNIVPKIFIDDDLNLHYVTFIKETNNRAYISYDPDKGKKEIRYAGAEAYALLGFPAALDIHNNIYCAEGLSISCLSPELLVKWIFSANNIILDSGSLFTSHFIEAGKSLVIYRWQADGSLAETINVPLDLPDLKLGKLSGLVNSGDFVIETYQGEVKGLWKYTTKSKTLDKLPETSGVNRFYLQPAATWQIDRAGNLFIPVSSAEGFHIVKVSIAPEK